MQRTSYPNAEVACQMQIAQIWNDLLSLQSQVHQQSLHSYPGSMPHGSGHVQVFHQNDRRSRANRKGLKERLRQKRRSARAQSPPTSGCDESNSEGHKLWHSSDESQAERSRALVVSSELTLLASMQEKIFSYMDQLRKQEAGLLEREIHAREVELSLCNEKNRADQAAARAVEIEGHLQAAHFEISRLEMAFQNEAARAQQAEQRMQELQTQLSDAEVARDTLSGRNGDLEDKLREAQTESGTFIARCEKLTEKLRKADIESGILTVRKQKLEEKLREAEIESGTLTARNLQLQGDVSQLQGWFQPEWGHTEH